MLTVLTAAAPAAVVAGVFLAVWLLLNRFYARLYPRDP